MDVVEIGIHLCGSDLSILFILLKEVCRPRDHDGKEKKKDPIIIPDVWWVLPCTINRRIPSFFYRLKPFWNSTLVRHYHPFGYGMSIKEVSDLPVLSTWQTRSRIEGDTRRERMFYRVFVVPFSGALTSKIHFRGLFEGLLRLDLLIN